MSAVNFFKAGASIAMDSADGNRWWIYIISCDDDRLYTGITTDLQRRWLEHSGRRKGAKFFRGRKPSQLVYVESAHDRASASRREATIKKLPRTAKLKLLDTPLNELHTLDRALLPAAPD
jgi:putative endonuclease